MPHPDHTAARLAQGYRASGLGPAEAQAAAEADLAIGDATADSPGATQTERRALSAQEYAVWALERAGFTQPMSNGRDPWDGMILTAPCGGQIEIKPLDPIA